MNRKLIPTLVAAGLLAVGIGVSWYGITPVLFDAPSRDERRPLEWLHDCVGRLEVLRSKHE
jgi:hypothetical protein